MCLGSFEEVRLYRESGSDYKFSKGEGKPLIGYVAFEILVPLMSKCGPSGVLESERFIIPFPRSLGLVEIK